MPFREPAPDGSKGQDNLPLMVLTDGALLKGKYAVKYLTAGGMSIIYTALMDGDKYLLKEVEASDSKGVLSLTQEKFMLERLNHPGIVKVFDLFEQDGFYYAVLEFIDGQSMEKLISPLADVFIQEKVILGWALQICDIFDYLHRQNPPIVYRDLKPRNLVKDKSGRLHLVDFGIARIYKQGRSKDTEAMGSALTASPEHYGGSQTDARSDIFTIGATLHFLITNGRGQGDEPFEFAPVRSISPRISENLEQVIKKCLTLDPRGRYQSIKEMRQALLNSREVPLPILEPLGNRIESAEPPPSPAPAGREAAGSPGSGIVSLIPTIGMAALCLVVIFIGALMVRGILKPRPATVPPSSLASSSAPASSPTIGTLPSHPAVTVTLATTPSASLPTMRPTESLAFTPDRSPELPPATIGGNPPARPTSAPPPSYPAASKRPPPLSNPGTLGTEPPDLPGDENPPSTGTMRGRNRGRWGGTGLNGTPGDLSALPTIMPGSSSNDDRVDIPRLYQDGQNGFQLLLASGWIVDSTVYQRESANNGNVVGAFSHLPPPNLGGLPLAVVVVRMEKPSRGISDPGTYLDEWVESDERSKRVIRRLSANSVRETVNQCQRASTDVVVHLMGNDLTQTRMVYVDSKGDRVAYIKCYFRARQAERTEKLKRFEEPVLNSFSFMGD
jgi:serine/threonine protein kinase